MVDFFILEKLNFFRRKIFDLWIEVYLASHLNNVAHFRRQLKTAWSESDNTICDTESNQSGNSLRAT